MPSYKIDLSSGVATSLDKFDFKQEGGIPISPQDLIADNPTMLLDIPDLDIQSEQRVIVDVEYSTTRGPMDILMITANADILIIEAKLLRNPESQRTVVAQSIDYAKAFYDQNVQDVIDRLSKSKKVDEVILEEFKKDESWVTSLDKNLSTGNFQIVILGDKIHPNVIGMVESIQSAPHMAFTIHLVELDPHIYSEDAITLNPNVVAKTVEVERSVIRIQIDHEKKEHVIESETPDKEGKGTKPILSPSQFLDKISKPEFRNTIEQFMNDWKEIGGDIRMETSGFSVGFKVGTKRIAPFFTYQNRVATLSPKYKSVLNISDEIYQQYREDLKSSQTVYDSVLVADRVEASYDRITVEDLKIIFDSAVKLGKRVLDMEQE